jgi:hypothetical protein
VGENCGKFPKSKIKLTSRLWEDSLLDGLVSLNNLKLEIRKIYSRTFLEESVGFFSNLLNFFHLIFLEKGMAFF